jgi:hypothetical protein
MASQVFCQSQNAEIEKLKKAVIHNMETLEDAFSRFKEPKNSISYDLSFVQPDDPEHKNWKNIDVTIRNEYGYATYFYDVNVTRMEAFLSMIIVNHEVLVLLNVFGLPFDSRDFAKYQDWYYDSTRD